MSLFKTRDLWSTSSDNDLFDLGCLKVANLGINKLNIGNVEKKTSVSLNSYNSIITGSYNGFLRIYNPIRKTVEDSIGFKAHELVNETSFPSPILQIETGRFVSTSNKNHIAILLPKKLAVYQVLAFDEGNVEHGNQYSLKFVYEHVLERNAFNMCKGSFGGNSNNNESSHEYLCVQSMDGMLSIFEYESFSVSFFLPKVLIPGPFKYMPKTDSFITVSSSWELEAYRYQVLATSSTSKTNANTKAKRIQPEYSFNLGESVLDIEIVNSSSQYSILVLGERNLYCLSETCVLRFMKKFDYNPSAFCAFQPLKDGRPLNSNSINFVIATHAKVLFVHDDVKVKWAAQLEHVPVQIAVTQINDLNGVIVTLSEDGKLKCLYLGTEPAFLNPTIKEDINKTFNFETAEKEYRMLQSQIKNAIMNTGSVVSTLAKSGLLIDIDIPTNLDQASPINRNQDTELKDPIDAIPSLTCKLTLKSVETVQNVKININCSLPLIAFPDTICYSSIGSVPFEQEVCFYAKTRHIPCSLNVTLCATYSNTINGVPKVVEKKFRLPLKLVMKSGQYSSSFKSENNQDELKNSASNIDQTVQSNLKKITLETNRPCVNLTAIFPEFSSSYQQTSGNLLAATFYGHANINVTIQGAKSGSNRYRLQSDKYESLWLLTQEFIIRLEAYYTKQSQFITISYQESLPIEEFRIIIDRHLELRQNIEAYKEMLEQSCIQFRAIQKRLLNKFKDKSPTSLDNMDALLEATYRQISALSDNYLNTQKDLSLTTNLLKCMSNLFVLLIGFAFKFNKESVEALEAVMNFQITDTSELGWEEAVSVSVSNLIRTVLSKSSKEIASQQLNQLKLPQDSSKLEKQIKSLVSKLENGGNILPNSFNINKSNLKENIKTTEKDSNSSNTQAFKSKVVTGGDYFDNSDNNDNNSNNDKEISVIKKREQIKEEPKPLPRNTNKLPTFEELMASEEMKKKNLFNFDDTDDI